MTPAELPQGAVVIKASEKSELAVRPESFAFGSFTPYVAL
ncbi:hypothetical protein H4W80_005009 [Nonomuraea angiospora]|uniref:Uncharacterized protein n=1 Tax=Nonomuraea angiospora TaxID=46172 RepID=A0ABR9M344_9ACTN|nr:hypothetical protein [Nonomuraea angiospora]